MSNILEPEVEAELAKPNKIAAVMGVINWSTGPVRFHNGIGVIRADSEDWYGVGEMGDINEIINGDRLTLVLNTSDAAQVTEAVKDDATGGEVRLYLAVFDEYMRYKARQLIFLGFINKTTVSYKAPPSISVECISYGYRWNQPKNYTTYNAASQRALYPNDSFCDDVENVAKGPLSSYSGSQSVGGTGSTKKTGSTRQR